MNNPTTAELVKWLDKEGAKAACYEEYEVAEKLHAAADRLEELEADLSACKSDMTAYARRKIKDECELCKHAAPREFCREADYCCSLCNHTEGCVCAWCQRGDQFEWRGVPIPEPPKEETHESERAQ